MEQRQFQYWKWAGLRWLVLGAGVLQLMSLAMQINDWIELAGSGFQPFEPAGAVPGQNVHGGGRVKGAAGLLGPCGHGIAFGRGLCCGGRVLPAAVAQPFGRVGDVPPA